MPIPPALCDGPSRFDAIGRRPGGIGQQALTRGPRRLERSGISTELGRIPKRPLRA